jgi:hypothetical protein
MGAIMLLVSLLGLFGACCSSKQRFQEDGTLEVPGKWKRMSNRILYAYFSIIMLTVACLIYGCLLCFIWSDKANDYVDAYWEVLDYVLEGSVVDPEDLKVMMHRNSKAAGGMCLGMIFINIICVHCCAVLMGYKYTSRKTVMWINGFGFMIGLSVMIIAFMPQTQEVGVKNSWLPEVIGFIGILLVFFAIIGFFAASRLKAGLLIFNTACLGVLSILLLGFAIFCLADAKDAGELVRQQLPGIVDRFVNVCPGPYTCFLNTKVVPPTTHCPCCRRESQKWVIADNTTREQLCPGGAKIANSTKSPRCCPQDVMSTTVFVDCCDEEAALLVWNNLSLLGVTCCAALVAILLNMGSSFILYRRIKKDLQDDLDHGELDGLEDGIPREHAASRAQKYRTQEPDDGL